MISESRSTTVAGGAEKVLLPRLPKLLNTSGEPFTAVFTDFKLTRP